MATLPEGLSQKDIDRYAQLDAGIKKLSDEHEILNKKIKKTHQDAGITGRKTLIYPSEKYGAVVVTVGQQKRLDAEALEKAYPEAKAPEFYSSRLDATLVPVDILTKFKTNVVQTLSIKTAE